MAKRSGRTVSRRPDGIWANTKDGASRASSLHDTQRHAEPAAKAMLVCRAEMPEPIRHRFETLAGLISASYHNHALLDVATEYTLVTFEMSFRVRYHQLMGRPTKMKLDRLIAWADTKSLLDDVQGARILQYLRNETLHASQSQRFSTGALPLAHRVLEVCNAVFEDSMQRAVRVQHERQVRTTFHKVERHGGVLDHNGRQIDVVLAKILRTDTLANPSVYDLLFWPRFDPLPHADIVDEGEPIIVRRARCEIVDGAITFHLADSVAVLKVGVTPATDHVRWLEQASSSPFPVHAVIRHRIAVCTRRSFANYVPPRVARPIPNAPPAA